MPLNQNNLGHVKYRAHFNQLVHISYCFGNDNTKKGKTQSKIYLKNNKKRSKERRESSGRLLK